MGAVNLDDEKVITVWVSFGRSGLEASAFLKKVRDACEGELPRVFVDGGKWYPWALNKRLFGDIECRIRRFWNGFIGNYNRKSMQLWIEAFAGFRNYLKNPKGVLS